MFTPASRTAIRAALVNATMWGASWGVGAFGLCSVLKIAGLAPAGASWFLVTGLAIRVAFWGFVMGGVFALVARLAFFGKRIADINWIRFALTAGVATAVLVPLLLQLLNLISSGHTIAWSLVLDDSVWTGVFGGAAAGISLRMAQYASRRTARMSDDATELLDGSVHDGVREADYAALHQSAAYADVVTRDSGSAQPIPVQR